MNYANKLKKKKIYTTDNRISIILLASVFMILLKSVCCPLGSTSCWNLSSIEYGIEPMKQSGINGYIGELAVHLYYNN